jgi:hypothetical protein
VCSHLKMTPPSTAVEPIMFLSRLLTPAEKQYWATELEVSCIVWVVRKIRHMIEAAPEDLTPVAYTDHIATINLATSLVSASPDRLNLRLVRASQYLQQFRLQVHHKAGSHVDAAPGNARSDIKLTGLTTSDAGSAYRASRSSS